jgi:hypothetical protein
MLEPPRAIVLTRRVQPSPSIEKRFICSMRFAAKSMPERRLLPREPTRQPFRAARESHLAARRYVSTWAQLHALTDRHLAEMRISRPIHHCR